MNHEEITHIDLFSGIGGFSLAADRVFGKVNHTFVEWDDFCQEVLKKHWPHAEYHKDIRQFVADSKIKRNGSSDQKQSSRQRKEFRNGTSETFLLTGGFPCQPFSQAGRRQGTADDRYLWPPMLEAISIFRPEWVIAENVAGLVTWNDGLVLETVCADLEREGYEVQPFIIPACAVGAPHRRDRIWFVAHNVKDAIGKRGNGRSYESKKSEREWVESKVQNARSGGNATNSSNQRFQRRKFKNGQGLDGLGNRIWSEERPNWNKNWPEVATRLCRVDDGIPRRLDRNPRLKSLGNAIVPQVAEEIFKFIKISG